jgi:CHAT domain-containing protein
LLDPTGKYLLHSFTISYSPSGGLLSLLKSQHRDGKPQRALLAVGGVEYEPMQTGHFAQTTFRGLLDMFGAHPLNLPKTTDEVLAISKIVPGRVTTLLGADATEAYFKGEPLARFKILHMAVHAVADTDFPDRAALILGREKQSKEDGLLQVREIVRLPLRADLVILSACDTALGKLEGEEGVSSLEQAFFMAGARSVVASLWSADDSVTTTVMEHFYQHMVEGLDKAQALRQAKLDMLRSYGSDTAPFYWAGFVLAGESSSVVFVN